MKIIKSRYVLFFAALFAWAVNTSPALAEANIKSFYGEYAGKITEDGKVTREIRLSIQPAKKEGFEIHWSTTTFDSAAGKTKSYSVSFVPTARDNIYSSAMRRDLFGKLSPMDPLKGDPFVWCKIQGDSLIVYSLLINDNGGYEMQDYVRTLTDTGLKLNFSRIIDGQPQKVIIGEYTRVK